MATYFAAGNRCAVHIPSLKLPCAQEEAIRLLSQRDFQRIDFDILSTARSLVGKAQYKRGARMHEAPDVFDCSSLTKWLYGQRGIWIPRRSIQQREYGSRVFRDEITAGDLVFTSGHIDYYHDNPEDGVGHVGIATGEGTVIHAANRKVGIIESGIERFIGDDWRGATRFIPEGDEVITLKTPTNREVESSDDIKWIILKNIR